MALYDEDGTHYFNSIETPSYSHCAGADAPYDDTADDTHDLIAREMKGSILTNSCATADKVYNLVAAEIGMNFIFQVIAGYQVDLNPDGTETLWFNGVQMAEGEHIVNSSDNKGDVMACWSVETTDGGYEIFCKTDNSNFDEATPP